MNTHRIKRTTRISSSFPELILRIILLSLTHKIHLAVAVTSVICGALFQLMIPGLLGQAVDQSVHVFESSQAGLEELYWTALLLFSVSAIRGIFAFTHSFLGEAIGKTWDTSCVSGNSNNCRNYHSPTMTEFTPVT